MNYHFNYFENSELSTKGIIHTGEINIGVAYTGIFNTLGLEIFGGYGIADGNVLQAPPNYTADSNVDTYIPLGLRINYHF